MIRTLYCHWETQKNVIVSQWYDFPKHSFLLTSGTSLNPSIITWHMFYKQQRESKTIRNYVGNLAIIILPEIILNNTTSGLPWWRSGWESACRCRAHGFEPWSGKIPHAAERLGPWATAAEPARLEPVLGNKRGRDSERPAHRDEEWPPLATAGGGGPRAGAKTQHSHKKINK